MFLGNNLSGLFSNKCYNSRKKGQLFLVTFVIQMCAHRTKMYHSFRHLDEYLFMQYFK
jgi:hypothetical protein